MLKDSADSDRVCADCNGLAAFGALATLVFFCRVDIKKEKTDPADFSSAEIIPQKIPVFQ